MSLLLALGAALGWGIADFFAGRTSRIASALVVLWVSQWIGLVIVLGTVLLVGLEDPRGVDLIYAAVAGVALTLGLGALYRALAVGTMSIAAPIAATGVIIPVVIGIAGGDDPSGRQSAGIAAAVLGVALCARDPAGMRVETRLVARGVGLALLAAVGGGVTMTALAAASSAGVLWVLLVQRATVAGLALMILLLRGGSPVPARPALPAIIVVGTLDVVATGLFTAATIHGALSLVAVLGALYPVMTVVLGVMVLSERLTAHQAIGAGCALAGVAAIASG